MKALEIIILIAAIGIVVGVIAYSIYKKARGKGGGCGCDCSSCGGCPYAAKHKKDHHTPNK